MTRCICIRSTVRPYAISAESIAPGFERNKIDPVMQAFPIAAVSRLVGRCDRGPKFFASDQKPFRPFLDASPLAKLFRVERIDGGPNSRRRDVRTSCPCRHFRRNVNFRTRIGLYGLRPNPFTAEMTVSMIRLPEYSDEPALR